MRSFIFPVKLESFVRALDKAKPLPQFTEIPLQTPDDGCERYVMYSSELHHAVSNSINDPRAKFSRKRIAIPRARDIVTLAQQTKFEVYSEKYELIYSCPVVELKGELSMAVEIDLMSHLLDSTHLAITMM